jgi:hypothetical protein
MDYDKKGYPFCTDYDYLTIKYDPAGNQLWGQIYGPGLSDIARAIAVDPQGNVYVTGWSMGAGTGLDYTTVKYAPDGTQLWARRYDGPRHAGDVARSIALDPSGNVIVTGNSDSDYATIKYDPDGNTLWVARRDSGTLGFDGGYAVTVDALGLVYVTGSYGSQIGTLKYDSDGNELGLAVYTSPPSANFNTGVAIGLDGSGNAYVSGLAGQIGGGRTDYVTLKYDGDGDGNELWARRYDGAGFRDEPTGLALDSGGNVYVTGSSQSSGSDSSFDYATVKYSASGEEQWVARFNGGGLDNASAIALDEANDEVYVTGGSDMPGSHDMVTVQYDAADGAELCVLRPAGFRGLGGNAVALDGLGNVHVAGATRGKQGANLAAFKYAAN